MAQSNVLDLLAKFKENVRKGDISSANDDLQKLKFVLIGYESLPPILADTPDTLKERVLARETYEYAVILSLKQGNKELFQKYFSSLKPFYMGSRVTSAGAMHYEMIGLNLCFLLTENRLADFHTELELLTEQEQTQPVIDFCIQLQNYLMIGAYDQVLRSAQHSPVEYYKFFLTSLLETVRLSIGECLEASYQYLTLESATKILMFTTTYETEAFITSKLNTWKIDNDVIQFKVADLKSEELNSTKLIGQCLSYASELERIV